jgi:hypothetical protein
VLFIGTQFSNLYTAVDQSTNTGDTCPLVSVCCLLVLDSVTSTPQWIRQPKPRDDVHDVCVFVCKCVIGSSRASQPLDILAYAFSSTSAFSLRLMSLRLAVLAVGATPAFLGSSAPAPRLPSLTAHARAHPDYTLLDPRVCPTCFFISILRSLMCLSTFPCTLTSCSSSRKHEF